MLLNVAGIAIFCGIDLLIKRYKHEKRNAGLSIEQHFNQPILAA
jgi:hypothetical protein